MSSTDLSIPLREARGLPNAAYVDRHVFDRERESVLGSTWTAIAYASDVAESGSIFPVDFMGVPLLLTRDAQGEVRMFHNVCSHRGMKLASEPGKVPGVVRCPYHSWCYSLQGELVNTPLVGGRDRNDCEGFDRARHGLKSVPCAVWMGIVFVNLSGEGGSFEDFITPLESRWRDFLGAAGGGEFRAGTGSKMELDVQCNWKLAVENYCESYHLPWIHPALNTYSPLDEHFNIVDGDGMSGQGTHLYELSRTAGIVLPTVSTWPADRIQEAQYISLYPNALLGLQADHFFSVLVVPVAEDRSLERLQICYVGDAAEDQHHAACRDAVLQSWDTVFREDIPAVEGMQAGRRSPGFDGGVLTPVQDVPTHHFHRWVAARLTGQAA